jgi:hypothetical protein
VGHLQQPKASRSRQGLASAGSSERLTALPAGCLLMLIEPRVPMKRLLLAGTLTSSFLLLSRSSGLTWLLRNQKTLNDSK